MLQIFHISVYVYIYTKLLWNVKNDSISKIANLITNRCRCLNLAHSQRLQRICITITVKSRDPFSFLFFNFFPFPSYFLSSHCLFHLYLTKFRDRRFLLLFCYFFLLLFLIGHNLQIKIKLVTLFKYIWTNYDKKKKFDRNKKGRKFESTKVEYNEYSSRQKSGINKGKGNKIVWNGKSLFEGRIERRLVCPSPVSNESNNCPCKSF